MAATKSSRKTRIERKISIRRSYRMGNQMSPPKQVFGDGQATVGIQERRSMNDTTAIQIIVFHLPRGANRSCL